MQNATPHEQLAGARRSKSNAFTTLTAFATACAAACAVMLSCAQAHAQIRNPNDHTKYDVELEPHLVYQWANQWWWNDDGIGVGLRASIPVIQNGPVPSINNNLAVTFGVDWAHFDYSCGPGYACSGNDVWVPIAAQWNFFLTEAVSVFPELGLAVQHSSISTDVPYVAGVCTRIRGGANCGSDSHTRLDLVMWLGARFMLSRSVGLTLRLGTPSLLAGVNFLL